MRSSLTVGAGKSTRTVRAFGIFTKHGNDVTNRFSSVAKEVRKLSDEKLILDAELVAVGEDGWPSFYALHTRNAVVTAWCFDILSLEGLDLTPIPLGKRRDILSKVVPAELKGPLRLSEPFDDAA